MLDLRCLRFGQPEFALYPLKPPAPISRLQYGLTAKCAERRHHHTRHVCDIFIHCHAITPMTSPFISSGLVLMLRVDWIYPAV